MLAPKQFYSHRYLLTSPRKEANLRKPCGALHQNRSTGRSTCKPPQTVNNFCLLEGKKGSASFCMTSAIQSYGCAKADRGILAECAWGVMWKGFVFLGMLAFA